MVSVGGGALEAVEDQLLEASDVFATAALRLGDADSPPPGRISPSRSAAGCQAAGPSSGCGVLPAFRHAPLIELSCLSRIPAASAISHPRAAGVEIDVGYGGEKASMANSSTCGRGPNWAARWAYIAMPLVA